MPEQEQHPPTADSQRTPTPSGADEAEARSPWEGYSPEILDSVLDP
jgi:hypothetical protein